MEADIAAQLSLGAQVASSVTTRKGRGAVRPEQVLWGQLELRRCEQHPRQGMGDHELLGEVQRPPEGKKVSGSVWGEKSTRRPPEWAGTFPTCSSHQHPAQPLAL